jgi:gas vesicle protein
MRTLVAFLLGLIIGAIAILFLPDPRRDELNAEVRAQTDALQAELRKFGDQIKNVTLPKPESGSPTPTASPSGAPR